MRILTGDECGLLKEVIPELSRPAASTNNGGSIHSGNARPSATSIQAAAAAQMQQVSGGGGNGGVLSSSSSSAVRKIEESEGQSRQRGVISMAFVPPPSSSSEVMDDEDDDGDTSSSFQFATLRMNGVVQLWSGNRSIDNEEGHVTPATYRQVGLCQNVFRDITTSSSNSSRRNPSDEENENDVSSSFVDGTNNNNSTSSDNTAVTGWNAHQPIRPIAMVSSHRHDTTTTSSSTNNNNPILACADSMGNISLLNSQNLQKGILSTTYNAFDLSTTQIIQAQQKSNIKHSTSNNAVLTYTKGRYANTAICTALELLGSNGERLAIGGRERGIRILDVTTGQLLWKAKNLPPDPQTLLQQPQWTTCIQSLTMNGNTQDLLGTGTAYKQVQIYDVRVNSSTSTQRRPVLYTPEGLLTHRITTLCQLPTSTHTLAIGDSTGDCHLIDTRRMHSGKQYSAHRKQSAKEEIGLGRLVGPGGSIRSLVIHPTLPYLACVGLDRKLWTWDVSKRKMMDCVYLKQRLNCALFCGDDCWSDNDGRDNDGGEDEEGEGGEVEYEELDEEWNNKRERELEEDQDEVEDYIDSDDDEGGDEKQDSGDETASDSEEEGDDSGGSGSSEEEEEEPSSKRGKRQKR